jgi:uncharacterized protein YecT (DUF1311 family)
MTSKVFMPLSSQAVEGIIFARVRGGARAKIRHAPDAGDRSDSLTRLALSAYSVVIGRQTRASGRGKLAFPPESPSSGAAMKRISMTAITLALLAYGATAGAVESTSELIRRDAPKGITETFYACIDKADTQNIEEAACVSQERERQDHRLNATYAALLQKLNPDQKKNLIAAERVWLKFRGSTIAFEDSLYSDAIVDNLQVAQNELFVICKRADELNEYLAVANGE